MTLAFLSPAARAGPLAGHRAKPHACDAVRAGFPEAELGGGPETGWGSEEMGVRVPLS